MVLMMLVLLCCVVCGFAGRSLRQVAYHSSKPEGCPTVLVLLAAHCVRTKRNLILETLEGVDIGGRGLTYVMVTDYSFLRILILGRKPLSTAIPSVRSAFQIMLTACALSGLDVTHNQTIHPPKKKARASASAKV